MDFSAAIRPAESAKRATQGIGRDLGRHDGFRFRVRRSVDVARLRLGPLLTREGLAVASGAEFRSAPARTFKDRRTCTLHEGV